MVPPEIRIQTTFVGADAETVQQSVATPIEEQMSGVDNMNYMYSINANNGVMRMVVNFDVKTDPNMDQMLTQLREAQAAPAIASASSELRGDHFEIPHHAHDAGGALLAERHL